MRKFINLVALAALLFVPWVAKAQSYENVPYSTGFEGLSTGSLPTGWVQFQTSAGYDNVNFPCAYNYSGNARNGNVYFEFETHSGQSEIVALPLMENINTLKLNFWASAQSSYLPSLFEVGVWDDSDSSFTPVDTITFTTSYDWGSGYHEYTVYFANYSGSGERIAMRATGSGSNQYTLMMDDVAVSEDNGCYPLSNLHLTASDGESITIAWSDGENTGASYTVSYWKDGSTDTVTVSGISNTFYTATGLDAVSLYHFSVMPNCPTGDGLPVSGDFSTDCAGGGCNITVEMTDSYGDGWNNALINFYQGGTLAGSAGISTYNNSATATVHVCSGVPVTFSWQSGYYDSECSYIIYDGGMGVAYNSATDGVNHNGTIAIPCPTCMAATGLAVDATDENSITLKWDASLSASSYVVYLNGQAEASVTDTSYTFYGLDANTAYSLGVQVVCSGSDSANTVSITGRTDCGSLTLPFADDFDSYANGTWPPCWHRLHAYGTDPSVNAQFHHSGSQAMFLLANNDTNLFCTPSAIPASGDNIYVRYHAYMQTAYYGTPTMWIKAGVMTDTSDVSTFITLDSVGYHNFNNVFEEREFNTAALDPSATYWVAWMFFSSSSSYRGAVDDIYVNEIPSCLHVSSIGTDSISSESITLTWVDNANSGAGYTVSCWADTGDTLTVSTSDTSYLFDNLSANTLYHFSVEVNCGSEDAEAVVASFRTSCGISTIPFMEGFEDAGALSCWQVLNPAYNTGHSTSEAHTGSGCFLFYYTTDPPEYLISPELAGTENGLKVEFYYKRYSANFQESFKVGYSTTNDSTNAFTWGDEVTDASSSYQLYSGIMPAGTKYVAVQYTAFNMYGLYIDDINFMLPPTCMPPFGLYADNITANGATLHWTAPDGQNNFIIQIDSAIYTTTDTFYTVSGLDARTTYNVSVASDCGDTSDWVSSTFTTDCLSGSCDITVDMTDSYGDGWNGNAVYAYQNGILAGSATLAGGANGTDSINVCSGTPVELRLHVGNYASEIGLTLYDGSGATLYTAPSGTFDYSTADGTLLATTPDACPSCLRPANLTVSVIDSNALTFTWTEDYDVNNYIVSFNGGAWTAPNGIASHSVTGLNANTAYTFSVMAVCIPGADTSAASTITVKTSCGEMTVPYTEDFEAETQGTVPSCWTVVRPGYSPYPGVSTSAHNGTKALTLAANYNDSTTIATSIVPLAGDEIHVSFWASVNQGNTLYAGVMTDLANDTTFIPLLTVPYNNSTYTLYEFNTSSLPFYNQYYVAFRLVTGGSNRYADLDDINIRQDDGCLTPTNLVATPSAASTTLSWHNGSVVSNFLIQYREAGSPWGSPITSIDTTYSLTGLNAASQYEVRVGLICGNDTLWSTITTFQTPCGLMSVPYFEDFDAYAVDVMPPCWGWSSVSATHWDGGVFLKSYHGGGSEYVVVPELNGAITKLKIDFDTKVGTPTENDGILIGVADANGTLLAWLDTIQDPNFSRNNHVHKTVYFPNYLNLIPANAARVAFAQYRNWNEWALIDNISIEVLPDCYPVDNLTGHNLDDPENTYFTWTPQGGATQWQVYVDTVTVDIDSVETMPFSSFTNVYSPSYTIPIGMIQGGGIYNIFVRSHCGLEQSSWVKYEFGAGTIIMEDNTVADTAVGCGFVVYDNGGPIAGYLANTNSTLVLRSENVGSQLQVFGGKFGFGMDPATLTIYDGEGTTGTVLYTYNTVNGRDTFNTVLATSTTGSLTINFNVSGTMCHTGYELYIRCTGEATCPRPTELTGEMISASQATVTWNGTAPSYDFYYRLSPAGTWVRQAVNTNSITLTGLMADTVYDMYVVALCSATDSSMASQIRQLNTQYSDPVAPCSTPTNLTSNNITYYSAVIGWTSTGTETSWNLEVNGSLITSINTNPYTLTGLNPATNYTVRVQAVCDATSESDWSGSHTFMTQEEDTSAVYYTVTVSSSNPAMGTVSGTGTYVENSVITITAVSNPGYHFVQWNDGNLDSVRTIVVTGNLNFIAQFASNSTGIDDISGEDIVLFPNPARTTVTLTGVETGATVTVIDMNGRVAGNFEVRNSTFEFDVSTLAQGAYFVRIVGEQSTAIRKLIVK